MKFETTFNIGDKGWVYWGDTEGPQQVTVGQIRIKYTDSKGHDTGYTIIGDNYKPQKGYEEQYMCEETGIDSGTVYTLGRHIFATEEQCATAFADMIADRARRVREVQEQAKQEKLRCEATLRAQLAEIERIKAEGQP